MTQRFRLVEEYISDETVALLEDLLAQAVKGEVVGIAFITLNRQNRYSVGWGGKAHAEPVLALGLLERLRSQLNQHAGEIR